ncbi:MAG: Ig-like domain repeat protein, partial [Verrucomicrobiota bacterium]
MTTTSFRFHPMAFGQPLKLYTLMVAVFAFSMLAQAQISVTNNIVGNTNWTCPANVYSLQVEAYGGGGASGNAGSANYECTGGGAGGSYVRYTVNVTPGTVYNLTVGSGGATNAVAGGNGGAGGSSYFGNTTPGTTNGALVCAAGGPGGNGTTVVGTSAARVGGILGGIATTNGNIPLTSAQANFADFAGTSGGTSVGGGSGVAHSGAGGAGAGPSGSAGGGAGGPALTSGSSSLAGTNGFAPGGGAGGAANVTLVKPGGKGGAGLVVLTYKVNNNVAGSSTVVANPTTVAADGATTSIITVILQDASANPLSGKTVTLSSSRGGTTDTILPASVTTSAAGVATFTVQSTVGGSAILTATDTTDSIVLNQTTTVTFTSGVSIDHFTVIPSVSSTNAAQTFTATVQAYSISGPITSSIADGITVLLSSSGAAQFDANSDGTYGDNLKPLTNGAFTINVTDFKAEAITLTASVGTNTGTSASITIMPGAFSQLQLLLPGETAAPGTATGKTGVPTTRTAGGGFSVTVQAVDANWNMVSSTDMVGISAVNDANAILPPNTVLSGGVVSLVVTNILAGGGRALTATDISNGSITANTSPAYSVAPGAVARILVLAPGETATYGATPGKTGPPLAQHSTVGYPVTVAALDAQYNLVTNCTDTVGVVSGFISDTLPLNAALSGGTRVFSLTNNTVGSALLTASDASTGGVANGTTTVPVIINSTATALASSANPANEGSQITFSASISGAGLKTGTVTFLNGAAVLGTAPLAANAASLTTSGGAGTYAITAIYGGDANNSASTSSALSQVIQTGGGIANPAQMEDGFDYALIASMPTSTNIPATGPWYCTSDSSANTAVTGNLLIQTGDLVSTTTPLLKPLPNQTTNVAAHFYVNKGATDREFLRSIGNAITSGSAYFSFLLQTVVNPTTAGAPMLTMLASNVNNAPLGNDPVTLYGRAGSDSTHYNLGIQRLGGAISWAPANLADATNYIVVLQYTFGGTCQLFIDPTPGNSPPVANAVATGGAIAEPANIGTILFYESGTPLPLSDGRFLYDVMRVDSSWYNVTPPFGSTGLGATKLAFSPGSQIIQLN